MKVLSFLLCGIIGLLAAALPSRVAHAQTAVWRCDGPDCSSPDVLFNTIEDLTIQGFPSSVTIDMAPLDYVCTRASQPDWDNPTAKGSIPWTLTINAGVNSFLIGRHSAFADIVGTFQPGGGVEMASAPAAEVSYVFAKGAQDVFVPAGDTGVVDLGAFTSLLTGGSLWNGAARVILHTHGGRSLCKVAGVQAAGGGQVSVSIPVSQLGIQFAVADLLRSQFRTAVAQAIQ
jgi:hypothetical protein